MKTDLISQYVVFHQELLKEQTVLRKRLAQIEQALAGETAPAPVEAKPASLKPATAKPVAAKPLAIKRAAAKKMMVAKKPVRLFKNKMSLKEAILKVTAKKPLTKPEIIDAIKKIGYRSVSKDMNNSVSVVLYTGKQFKNVDGRFSPAK